MARVTHARVLPARREDLPNILALEQAGYPPDEAATEERLAYRLEAAAQYFWALWLRDEDSGADVLAGFATGTVTRGELTEASMAPGGHNPEGDTVCIHSVVVSPALQGAGLGTFIIRSYIARMAELNGVGTHALRRVMLLAHAARVPWYTRCGFTALRESPVVHGSEVWVEMAAELPAAATMPCLHVDAFTREGRAFTGNPAAVVVLPPLLSDAAAAESSGARALEEGFPPLPWMQTLAAENALSETAYVLQRRDGSFSLRWCTPACEVDLCGHATLAATHALFDTGVVPACQAAVHFHTRSGVLVARRVVQGASPAVDAPASGGAGSRGAAASPAPAAAPQYELDFPRDTPTPVGEEERAQLLPLLARAFGLPGLLPAPSAAPSQALFLGRTSFDVLLQVPPASFAALGAAPAGMDALAAIDARGVIVTAVGEGAALLGEAGAGAAAAAAPHFLSRWFGPRVGVPEDPVTGSAHCGLAPFWTQLFAREGAGGAGDLLWLWGRQASKRAGDVFVRVDGDRVLLRGTAVTVVRAVLATAALPPRSE